MTALTYLIETEAPYVRMYAERLTAFVVNGLAGADSDPEPFFRVEARLDPQTGAPRLTLFLSDAAVLERTVIAGRDCSPLVPVEERDE